MTSCIPWVISTWYEKKHVLKRNIPFITYCQCYAKQTNKETNNVAVVFLRSTHSILIIAKNSVCDDWHRLIFDQRCQFMCSFFPGSKISIKGPHLFTYIYDITSIVPYFYASVIDCDSFEREWSKMISTKEFSIVIQLCLLISFLWPIVKGKFQTNII